MADRGITFSAPMVRALLDGRKTQTRRLITKKPALDALTIFNPAFLMLPGNSDLLPRARGDRLYVREHWRTWKDYDHLPPRDMLGGEPVFFNADRDNCDRHSRHRQAMHMPRWASRLTLLVTEVRVQRLREISVGDVLSEGAPLDPQHRDHTQDGSNPFMCIGEHPWTSQSPHAWYHRLWDSLHTDPGTRWEDNPWIYAVTFDVRHGNIDQGER